MSSSQLWLKDDCIWAKEHRKARFAFAAIAFVITACSFTVQDTQAKVAQDALSKRIQSESNGLIKLGSFEKVYEMERGSRGAKICEISYTATVEALEDCLWSLGESYWDGSFGAVRKRPQGGIDAFNPHLFGKVPGTKGQQQHISGVLMLEKTENGWSVIE
jgi:hypothetical protein